jgi:hypothetical protein
VCRSVGIEARQERVQHAKQRRLHLGRATSPGADVGTGRLAGPTAAAGKIFGLMFPSGVPFTRTLPEERVRVKGQSEATARDSSIERILPCSEEILSSREIFRYQPLPALVSRLEKTC